MGFQYRGCTLGASLRNDAAIRILAQEKSGSGQGRSLLDSPCALCETTTPEIFITITTCTTLSCRLSLDYSCKCYPDCRKCVGIGESSKRTTEYQRDARLFKACIKCVFASSLCSVSHLVLSCFCICATTVCMTSFILLNKNRSRLLFVCLLNLLDFIQIFRVALLCCF